MSGNRKMLRDQVRRNLKQARKTIPKEYRESISFSSVFQVLKSSTAQTTTGTPTTPTTPTTHAAETGSKNEDSEAKSEIDI